MSDALKYENTFTSTHILKALTKRIKDMKESREAEAQSTSRDSEIERLADQLRMIQNPRFKETVGNKHPKS